MRVIYENNHTPTIGMYHDAIVEDGDTEKIWLYDSCGTYSLIADPVAIEGSDVDSFNGRIGIVTPLPGDYTASQITNVPSGSVSGADVQTAINELSTEKVSKGDLFTNVKDFGAIGDGVADDTAAIQAAINDTTHNKVYLPSGTYNISSPLYLSSRKSIFGDADRITTIRKTTTTPGAGSNVSPTSAVVDSYVKNAIIIIRNTGGSYVYDASISDMRLIGLDFTTDYGIYAPRTAKLLATNVEITNCRYGFVTHDTWMSRFTNVHVDCGTRDNIMGDTYGWTSDTYGFYWADDGSGLTTGTSLLMEKCWVTNAHYAYSFYELFYSSMSACAAEVISKCAYDFTGSRIALNGCGIEKANAVENIINLDGGKYTFSACSWYYVYGDTDVASAGISLTNAAYAAMLNCHYDNFIDPMNSINVYIDATSTITMLNTLLPLNGAMTPFMSKSPLTQGFKTIRSGQLVKQAGQLAVPADSNTFYNGFVLEDSGTPDGYAMGCGYGSRFVINRFDGANTYKTVLNINQFAYMCLGDTAATHSLTIPSVGNGIALYNTVNQLDNLERGIIRMVGNLLTIKTEKTGAGVLRSVDLQNIIVDPDGNITLPDGADITMNSTTGSMIGTATTERLAFYGSAPIIQPSGNALTALAALGLVASPVLAKADVGLGNVDNTSNATERAAAATLTNKTINGANNTITGIPIASGLSGMTPNTFLVASSSTAVASVKNAPAGAVVGTTDTQTLTNKRVTSRIGTVTSSATPTASADSNDQYNITSAAVDMVVAAPAGTPTDGQQMRYRIRDNGGARAISWSSVFRAVGTVLPTTTVAGKTMYVVALYNSVDTKWDVIDIRQEA